MGQYGDTTNTDATAFVDVEIDSYVGDTDADSTSSKQNAACQSTDFEIYYSVKSGGGKVQWVDPDEEDGG